MVVKRLSEIPEILSGAKECLFQVYSLFTQKASHQTLLHRRKAKEEGKGKRKLLRKQSFGFWVRQL